MPITLELRHEGRVAFQIYSDPLDMREIMLHTERMDSDVFDCASLPVYAILDFTRVTRLPRNLLNIAISRMKRPHSMSHSAILVTDNVLVHTLANVAIKVSQSSEVSVCRTQDEAWQAIEYLLEAEKLNASSEVISPTDNSAP